MVSASLKGPLMFNGLALARQTLGLFMMTIQAGSRDWSVLANSE
jgi:hypothetical protein